MHNKTLWHNGVALLVKRSRRRSLQLEISANGVIARAPMRMSEKQILLFALQKQTWIARQLKNQPQQYPALALAEGAQLPLLNGRVSLAFDDQKQGAANYDPCTGRLVIPLARCDRQSKRDTFIRKKVISWYRAQALCTAQNMCAEVAPQMTLTSDQEIKVRDYKRRWGSCDANGKISFNWRLIMAPSAILRYVVVHELAHCHEFNHSPKFWRIVEQHHPNWREHRDWLYNEGLSLYRI